MLAGREICEQRTSSARWSPPGRDTHRAGSCRDVRGDHGPSADDGVVAHTPPGEHNSPAADRDPCANPGSAREHGQRAQDHVIVDLAVVAYDGIGDEDLTSQRRVRLDPGAGQDEASRSDVDVGFDAGLLRVSGRKGSPTHPGSRVRGVCRYRSDSVPRYLLARGLWTSPRCPHVTRPPESRTQCCTPSPTIAAMFLQRLTCSAGHRLRLLQGSVIKLQDHRVRA